MGGSGTRALTALRAATVEHTVHRYDPGEPEPGARSYGAAAAAALGVEAERVFKTLVARTGGGLVIGLVPVSSTLDLKALGTALGHKRARLADPGEAERATGYVVGGISPFGQRRRLPIVVDSSAAGHATIYVSGGRRGLQVELAPAALLSVTGGMLAPIASASR